MNSQQFLILNIAILFFFVLWFFAGRRGAGSKTTQLQMKRGNDAPEGGVLQKNDSAPATPAKAGQGRYSHPKFQKFLEDEATLASQGKELNILFNYNGHTWDAYEVLGVPAGAGLVDVTKAYQTMLRTADPDSHEFLETAFKTILLKK